MNGRLGQESTRRLRWWVLGASAVSILVGVSGRQELVAARQGQPFQAGTTEVSAQNVDEDVCLGWLALDIEICEDQKQKDANGQVLTKAGCFEKYYPDYQKCKGLAVPVSALVTVCPGVRAPQAAIVAIRANWIHAQGAFVTANPSRRFDRIFNPLRLSIGLMNPRRPWHPVFNSLILKAGCP